MQVSDFGRKLLIGLGMLAVAAAIVATQLFGVGDRPVAEEGPAPVGVQPGPAVSVAPSNPGTPGAGVEQSDLLPLPLSKIAALAEDAAEFGAILEDSTLAPPDRLARLGGRASSLALDPALPPSSTSPPVVVFERTEFLSPQYVIMVVVNTEQPDAPRFISFADDGSGGWNVVGYSTKLPEDTH